MPKLSDTQVVAVCQAGGFSGSGLVGATALVFAESGGNTEAVHVNADTWHSVDRGLFQFNSHWHPEVTNPFDPVASAKRACDLSHNGANFSGWSTAKNGALNAQLGRATRAVKAAGVNVSGPGGGIGSVIGGVLAGPGGAAAGGAIGSGGVSIPNPLSGLEAIGAAVAAAAAWIGDPHNTVRILEVGAGLAILLAVTYSLVNETDVGKAATSAAKLAAVA